MHRARIAAFTLSETLVALVLMVIIVALASSVYGLISGNLKLVKENVKLYRDMEQAEFALELDFSRYHTVKLEDSVLVLKSPVGNLKYKMASRTDRAFKYLLRDQDTLLDGNFIFNSYYYGNAAASGFIDAVEISEVKTGYSIFVARQNDLEHQISEYGF
ncbi:MAG: hypothetical protein WBG46_08045 [Nonlabens sp.]